MDQQNPLWSDDELRMLRQKRIEKFSARLIARLFIRTRSVRSVQRKIQELKLPLGPIPVEPEPTAQYQPRVVWLPGDTRDWPDYVRANLEEILNL